MLTTLVNTCCRLRLAGFVFNLFVVDMGYRPQYLFLDSCAALARKGPVAPGGAEFIAKTC